MRRLDWLLPAVVAGSLVPFAVLGWRALSGGLGADPVRTALRQLGVLALLLLLASLACTPLKITLGWKWPMRLRRALGLCAFGAALAHLAVYVALDQALALGVLVGDVFERPFIALGFTALCLLVPLAATSTRAAQRRMGFEPWQRLHRLVYLVAALAAAHFLLAAKADRREPLVYATVVALLLTVRAGDALRLRRAARRAGKE